MITIYLFIIICITITTTINVSIIFSITISITVSIIVIDLCLTLFVYCCYLIYTLYYWLCVLTGLYCININFKLTLRLLFIF